MKTSKQNEEVLNWRRRYVRPAPFHLPKQWAHWLTRLNLRPSTVRYHKCADGQHRYFYLKGRGFVWRVAYNYDTSHHYFQRGDTYADFDRWALCKCENHATVPQTFAELKAFIERAETTYVQA